MISSANVLTRRSSVNWFSVFASSTLSFKREDCMDRLAGISSISSTRLTCVSQSDSFLSSSTIILKRHLSMLWSIWLVSVTTVVVSLKTSIEEHLWLFLENTIVMQFLKMGTNSLLQASTTHQPTVIMNHTESTPHLFLNSPSPKSSVSTLTPLSPKILVKLTIP